MAGRTQPPEQLVAGLHHLQHAAGGDVVGRLLHHRLVLVRVELGAARRIELLQAVALEGGHQLLLGHLQADGEVLDQRVGGVARARAACARCRLSATPRRSRANFWIA